MDMGMHACMQQRHHCRYMCDKLPFGWGPAAATGLASSPPNAYALPTTPYTILGTLKAVLFPSMQNYVNRIPTPMPPPLCSHTANTQLRIQVGHPQARWLDVQLQVAV